MTPQKYAFLLCVAIVFLICTIVYVKITDKATRRLVPTILASGSLGVISLCAVLIAELFCGSIIKLNICTFIVAFFLSLPGVAAMLFLNVI